MLLCIFVLREPPPLILRSVGIANISPNPQSCQLLVSNCCTFQDCISHNSLGIAVSIATMAAGNNIRRTP
jgi:hypothetical protein